MMKTRQKDFTKGDRDTQSCAAAQRFTRATECATIHWPFAPHTVRQQQLKQRCLQNDMTFHWLKQCFPITHTATLLL